MTLQLLGGMTVKQFLSRHWQKRPLLVRDAIPDFKGIIQRPELLRLALRDDVEARWVARTRSRWEVRHGPLHRRDFLPPRSTRWTVLVQGVNLHHAAADALLQRFAFIPQARLDDVMVSYATPGGGVGPHVDSYDVFLVQSQGRRRWRIGRARDRTLVPGAPLAVLARFEPEREWICEPGDVLYLPPGYAHDGIAVDDCITCSVGFRAPQARELVPALLARAEERALARPMRAYADPGLAPTRRSGEIPAAMARHARRVTQGIRLSAADIDIALGEHLSEPKASVVFQPPERVLPARRFASVARRDGVALDARSRLLYRRGRFFINGERVEAPSGSARVLEALADARRLERLPARGSALYALLYSWYQYGWLHPGATHGTDG